MALPFGVGELSSRLRRALSVRGRIPLDVDERVTYNVNGIDLGIAPWRSDGVEWQLTRLSTSIAAQFPSVSYHVNQANNGGNTTRAVITSLLITNFSAAVYSATVSILASTASAGLSSYTLEKMIPLGAVVQGQVKASIASDVAANAVDGGLLTVDVPIATTVIIPCALTLVPGYTITVQGGAALTSIVVGAQGVVWNGEGFALS